MQPPAAKPAQSPVREAPTQHLAMTPEEFADLRSQGYNTIPLTHTVLADLDTPLSVWLKLANKRYTYLFESAAIGSEQWGRYSIIGLAAREVLRVYGNRLEIERDGDIVETRESVDPLTDIEHWRQRFRVAPLIRGPRFAGGMVGYFGYDTMRYVEPRLRHTTPPDDLGTPDILLMVSSDLVIFDNVRGSMTFVTHVDADANNALTHGERRLRQLTTRLRSTSAEANMRKGNQQISEADFVSATGREPYMDAVEQIREYIRAGDVMQVVLSQRMSVPINAPPVNIYRALRTLNPSPYMYLLELGEFQIVGSSPEILARLDGREVTSRPLAGTRRRGETAEEDQAMCDELINHPKERAEHLMLIDLARNDVGRVAETGSVKVTERFQVEKLAYVMHISSNVVGTLRPDLGPIDLLRATLPVGTLSGAPKIRAMEIIDELEPVKRGIYGGAVGYIGWHDNMDMAIAIRTAVIRDHMLYVQAGGGVVADSVSRLEWKESMNKGRAIFRAAALAERGFEPMLP